MRYEYVIVPYRDGTAEGEVPVKDVIEKTSDLEAFFDICFGGEGDLSNKEIVNQLIEDGTLDNSDRNKPVEAIIAKLGVWLNYYNSPDEDTFFFYIKNLDTGEIVFNNENCDVSTWLYVSQKGWNGIKVAPELLIARGWL